jgi:hypothetical protein
MKELYRILGIKGMPSTAYHPQTDGQTERVNQELETYLRFYVNYQQDDWEKWLDQAEFVQNTRFHEAIQNTPFFLMHGYNPYTGIEEGESEKSPGASEWKRELWKARENARRAMEKAADSMKRFYDRKHKYPREYLKGQRVWLDARNLKTFRPSKKLDQKKLGPFTIIEKIGRGAYRLQLPKSWTRIHPVFNEILLTPVEDPQFIQQKEPEPPGPIDMEGEAEYEIEEVLSSRKRGRGIQYLVKWKGYGNEENTWEAKGNMDKAKEAIKEFHQKYPKAAREMVWTLRKMGIPIEIEWNRDEGDFGTKSILRKGYYQDSLQDYERSTETYTSQPIIAKLVRKIPNDRINGNTQKPDYEVIKGTRKPMISS